MIPYARNICFPVLLAALLTLAACKSDDDGSDRNPDVSGQYYGVFVLNEGTWRANKASLNYYDEQNGWQNTPYVVSKVNGESLGDVANHATFVNDKMYIVVNNSLLVYQVQMPTLKITGRTAFPEGSSPRQFVQVNDSTAYVSSMLDGKVYIIDTRTMAFRPPHIEVENCPYQMARTGDMVFLALGSYPNVGENNKVAVIDVNTHSVVKYIEMPIANTTQVCELNGKIWAASLGDYYTTGCCVARIDPATLEIDSMVYPTGYIYGMDPANGKIYLNSDSAVSRLDPSTLEIEYNFLTTEDLGMVAGDLIGGAEYDPLGNEYYVIKQRRDQNGECLVFNSAFEQVRSLETGLFPTSVLFYRDER